MGVAGEQPAGEGLGIGAGSGAMTARLLTAFPGLRMVATDCDAAMVSAARQTLAPFGERGSARRADAADLPFDDSRFGLVFSAATLHHVLAWEKALAEVVRVLRPGGAAARLRPARHRAGPAASFRGRPRHQATGAGPAGGRAGRAAHHHDPRQAGHRQTGRQVRR